MSIERKSPRPYGRGLCHFSPPTFVTVTTLPTAGSRPAFRPHRVTSRRLTVLQFDSGVPRPEARRDPSSPYPDARPRLRPPGRLQVLPPPAAPGRLPAGRLPRGREHHPAGRHPD